MLEIFYAWRIHTMPMSPPNMRLYTVGSSFLGVRGRRGWGRGHAAARRVGGRHGASAGGGLAAHPEDATSRDILRRCGYFQGQGLPNRRWRRCHDRPAEDAERSGFGTAEIATSSPRWRPEPATIMVWQDEAKRSTKEK